MKPQKKTVQKPNRNRTEQVNNPIQNYFLKDTLYNQKVKYQEYLGDQ